MLEKKHNWEETKKKWNKYVDQKKLIFRLFFSMTMHRVCPKRRFHQFHQKKKHDRFPVRQWARCRKKYSVKRAGWRLPY